MTDEPANVTAENIEQEAAELERIMFGRTETETADTETR